jgi:type I restriction enzyme S subunit
MGSVEMKDSGIKWIGKVPEHWKLMRFRYVCKVRQGLQIAQTDRFWNPGTNRLPYITIKSLSKLNPDYAEYIENAPERAICKPEDVLLARTGATGEVVTNQHGVFHNNFFLIDYDRNLISRDYLVFYLLNPKLKEHLILLAGTTTIPDLNHDEFLNIYVILPPLEEQRSICKYLNKKREHLSKLISYYLRLIILLKEKKQTIINQVLTKGLNLGVPMKDSGINWIGKVPEHWKCSRLGYLVELISGFAFQSEEFYEGEDGIRLVRGDNVTEGRLRWGKKTRRWLKVTPDLEPFSLKESDVLIGMDGSKVGKNYSIVTKEDLPALLVQRVARLRSNKELKQKFLYYLIANHSFSQYIDSVKTNVAVPHMSPNDIQNYFIPIPSQEEQEKIFEFLDFEASRIDSLVLNIKSQIGKIEEFDQSLTYSLITGKIELGEKIIL